MLRYHVRNPSNILVWLIRFQLSLPGLDEMESLEDIGVGMEIPQILVVNVVSMERVQE